MRNLCALAMTTLAWLGARSATFDVTAYGAKADGTTDSTAAIQKAIDACGAQGGGTVLVPGGGVYKTYTLGLRNNVELKIDRGATLKGGEDALRYPPFPATDVWRSDRCPRWNRRAMFYTVGQTNVAITGSGTIDGNAEAFHERVDGRWRRVSDTNITGRCVFFAGCRDVRFDDVLVHHPCGWSTWFLDCDRVQCRGVRIECHHEFPNGDGLHFGGCRDVTVSDCIVDAQDDAIILRSHQEQMRAPVPCERVTVANCTLRSNQSAIRIGWTGDAEVKDATFSNIVCPYSRLGVQFYLPKLRDPRLCRDPARGNGIPPPDFPLAPFAVRNLRFDNMQVNCFNSPFYIQIGPTENVACIRDVTFSNCKFTSQLPPTFKCRPEDHVSNWRFSNVEFEVLKPRGSLPPPTGLWFDNAKDITFDNVKWSYVPQETPEWSVTVQQVAPAGEKPSRPVKLSGARQPVRIETGADGAKRFVCDRLTDGEKSWNVRVVLEERVVGGGRTYAGRVENRDGGMRVIAFEGPYYDRVRTDPKRTAIYVPEGLGRRFADFPASVGKLPRLARQHERNWFRAGWHASGDGRAVFATGDYPGATGLTMPWLALDGDGTGLYAAVQDREARPLRMLLRYDPDEERTDVGFEHHLFLEAGQDWQLAETVFAPYAGDWHVAAKKYRAWYDGVHKVGACSPEWTRGISGWLLVILKQQNEQVFWPYADIPKLCDVAEANGLDCIGLFGWTKGGHDHLYPDYDPDPQMGGVDALKAGIAEAHRRGLRVIVYANGQLQQVGATAFWREHGKDIALAHEDGTLVIQNYHKYSDIPKYDFALGCLFARPWQDRMRALAEQAEGFGADGILYDQLGIFAPFACWGRGHGHPTPGHSYCAERPGFIRTIAEAVQNRNPQFAILTEGLHDTILDSIALFHGCETGTYPKVLEEIKARAAGGRTGAFPELWRYTFPELVTTTRVPSPLSTRTMANYTTLFGMRHDIELRYAPDRDWVLDGKVPAKEGYGTVRSLPDIGWMQTNDPKVAAAYLKDVNLFQRQHAKYLLQGSFRDEEGFALQAPAGVLAKRYVAKDGTSAVLVWNTADRAAAVSVRGLGRASEVAEPGAGTVAADAPLAGDTLRLYCFGEGK